MERWRRVEELFGEAVELTATKRETFLVHACGDDHELRTEVESLLAAADGADLAVRQTIEAAAAQLVQDEPAINMEVPGYEIGERLGAGGFGEVYRARHRLMDREVAIKVLNASYLANPDAVARFVAEARAVGKLSHPGIVDVFDFGQLADGRQFCVMELIRGKTLRDVLRERGRLTLDDALPILTSIADAIDAAHAAKIAHRDLKPDNVFVLDAGGVKLIDFGIAKLVREDARGPTETGPVLGTPLYMSPEQCRGKEIGLATDAYSFGALAYHVLAGAPPFSGDSLELALHHLHDMPEPPSKLCGDLGPNVDRVLLGLLAKDPAARPMPLAPVVAGMAAGAAPMRRPRRRRRAAIVVGAVALAILAIAGWRFAHHPAPHHTGRRTVAVLAFENSGDPAHAWAATAAGRMLATSLRGIQELRVPDANSVAEEQAELGIAPTYMPTHEQMAQIRAAFRPDYVVTGLSRPHAGLIALDVRLLDRDGRIAARATEDVPESELPEAAARLASKLGDALDAAPLSSTAIAEARKTWPARVEAMQHYALGLAAIYHEDHQTAIGELTRVTELEPDFALAYLYLSLGYRNEMDEREDLALERAVLLSSGLPERERLEIAVVRGGTVTVLPEDTKAAIAAMHRLTEMEIDPGNGVVVGMSTVARDPDEAQRWLAILRALPPPASNDPNIDLLEASIERSRGHLERCIALATSSETKALRTRRPNMFLDARDAELACLVDLKRTDEVLALVDDTLARASVATGKPQAASLALVWKARALELKGDLVAAEQAHRAALTAMPAHFYRHERARRMLDLARLLVTVKKRDEAKELVAEVERACGAGWACAAVLGQPIADLYARLGDAGAQRRALIAALDSARKQHLDLDAAYILKDLGGADREQLRLDEAIAEAREAAAIMDAHAGQLEPDDYADNYRGLSTSLGETGRFDEAMIARQKALDILKGNKERWHFSRSMGAYILLLAGRFSEAEQWARDVLVDPSRDDARAFLVEALVAQGKLADADQVVTELVSTSVDASFARAWVAVHHGTSARDERRLLDAALTELRSQGKPLDVARLEVRIARLAAAAGAPRGRTRLAELGKQLRVRGLLGLASVAERESVAGQRDRGIATPP
ncbi:MAG TPA: protein kinase [Kofleriaceae bacterium]|nr:protein kinase [Kofleriaceae bacterium]